jgi:L-lactate utilization protein LutC
MIGHGEYGQQGGIKNYEDWNMGTNSENSKEKNLYHAIPRILEGFEDKSIIHMAGGKV